MPIQDDAFYFVCVCVCADGLLERHNEEANPVFHAQPVTGRTPGGLPLRRRLLLFEFCP